MPSVHVGWAFLIAFVVITVSDSRWRWLVVAHPVLTLLVVVATANHFWLDGIVACLLLAVSIAVATAWEQRRVTHKAQRAMLDVTSAAGPTTVGTTSEAEPAQTR